MNCACFIVPRDVLAKFGKDKNLSEDVRKALKATEDICREIRQLRVQATKLTCVEAKHTTSLVALTKSPSVMLYDCKNTKRLPGAPVKNPARSPDPTAKRTNKETRGVARFYKSAFKRNSIDDLGMTLISSIHYGSKFNNAMWDGSQMIYGDGDNQLFIDFTASNDVIAHELTHGVTQHSLQLDYSGDAGGLNESMSDCFGAMFRQWEAKQTAKDADWLIGADIIGPAAKKKGFICLRDMANPAAKHALAPQPTHYSEVTPDMDPHYSSGPPNLAFYTACMTLGGKSWQKIGKVWYEALTGFGPTPNMKMKKFADRTRQVAAKKFEASKAVAAAVDAGWKKVGL